jgi:hypothetical protein
MVAVQCPAVRPERRSLLVCGARGMVPALQVLLPGVLWLVAK